MGNSTWAVSGTDTAGARSAFESTARSRGASSDATVYPRHQSAPFALGDDLVIKDPCGVLAAIEAVRRLTPISGEHLGPNVEASYEGLVLSPSGHIAARYMRNA